MDAAAELGTSDFARVGGDLGLRAIIDDFVRRVFADVMIGFLFKGKSEERLRELEYRFAAEHLGGAVAYTGRPLREAHRAVPISSGHFGRRTQILRETLARHAVPDDVAARWLAHVEGQRGEVVGHFDDACGPASDR